MPYDEKSKQRIMKYLEKLKEIRFRVKPDDFTRYEAAAREAGYPSMRQFYLDALNEKADDILSPKDNN